MVPFSTLYSQSGEKGRLHVTSGYARSTNNSSASAIAGLAITKRYGDTNEFGIEATYGKWKNAQYDDDGSPLNVQREHHLHFLLNYRRYIPLKNTPVAFHVDGGAGIGTISGLPDTDAMREALDNDPSWDCDGDGINDNPNALDLSESNKVVFIAAATVGFVIKSDDGRYSMGVSYRCLWEGALRYTLYYGYDKTHHELYDARTYRAKSDLVHMVLANISISF